MPTPTVKRAVLGNELLYVRKRAGLDIEESAKLIGKSVAVVSRIENGLTGIENDQLTMLVEAYKKKIGTNPDGSPVDGLDSVDLADFKDMNTGTTDRGRWRGFRGTHAKWFRRAVDLESDASSMRIYNTELFHGLLQSEEYMKALFGAATMNQGDLGAAFKLRARRERQEVLTRGDPPAPDVTFVLSQSVLERVVGSPRTQARQLLHVAEFAEQPNIHVHVLPFQCKTTTSGLMQPFAIFRIPSRSKNSPPLEYIYTEQWNNADYLNSPADVEDYTALWSGLLGAALDPVASQNLLESTARKFLAGATPEGEPE